MLLKENTSLTLREKIWKILLEKISLIVSHLEFTKRSGKSKILSK